MRADGKLEIEMWDGSGEMERKPVRKKGSRLVILALAIVLPALALIVFSTVQLKSLQRDHAVEASMQRQFQQMLAISEKQMAASMYDMVDAARQDFSPRGMSRETLQRVLDRHPNIAHAFYYDQQTGLLLLSRASRMGEPDFRSESESLSKTMGAWLPVQGEEIIKRMWDKQAKEGHPVLFDYGFTDRGPKKLFISMPVFLPPGAQKNHLAIAGIAFDAEYLRDQFFPKTLDYLADCPENPVPNSQQQGAAMMLYARAYDADPIAVSSNYDGGKPEVQRVLDSLPGLSLGIKYRGTSIAAMSDRFLRTNYAVLGGLSLLMAAGILLTYRNVKREVALAKLKSDFVSNVSHELRTPLASIRLYAETLELGRVVSEEKQRSYYAIIRKESERLTALINNILDFSRIEAGRKEYDFRQTDLDELVRTTLDSYRYEVEQQGFNFEEKIEPGLPPVNVDREAIARSLLNLVNNAVKYSPGEKFLRVNVHRVNGTVHLDVIDHGIGIPGVEHQRIFEKFYRASDPLVHNTKGSGLGLSLVKHVVEAHGGQVTVDSSPGNGSKFTICLPVDSQKSAAAGGA